MNFNQHLDWIDCHLSLVIRSAELVTKDKSRKFLRENRLHAIQDLRKHLAIWDRALRDTLKLVQ